MFWVWILISWSWDSILFSSSSDFSFEEIMNKPKSAKYCSEGAPDSMVCYVIVFCVSETLFWWTPCEFYEDEECSMSSFSSSSKVLGFTFYFESKSLLLIFLIIFGLNDNSSYILVMESLLRELFSLGLPNTAF